jgi:hypothetical protein
MDSGAYGPCNSPHDADFDFAGEWNIIRPTIFSPPGRCLTRRLILPHQCARHMTFSDVDLA